MNFNNDHDGEEMGGGGFKQTVDIHFQIATFPWFSFFFLSLHLSVRSKDLDLSLSSCNCSRPRLNGSDLFFSLISNFCLSFEPSMGGI